jgi:hypothetical protein
VSEHTDRADTAIENFDGLYQDLARAWESHQELRRAHPPIADLALSSAELEVARASMWAWWKTNRIEHS